MEMLCLMHQGSQYGYLKVNHKVILTPNLARIVGATLHETEGWLNELNDAGVFSVDDDGCIFSRRMIRDEEVRMARAAGGILGGNPSLKKDNHKVGNKVNLNPNLRPTPSSSSSSSSSKNKPPLPPTRINALDDGFEEFWQKYPKKVGKKAAHSAWKKAKVHVDDVLKALEWQTVSDQWTRQDGQFIPNPATYINQGRWTDEPIAEGVPF